MTLRIRIPAIFFPVGSAFGSLHKYNNYFYYFITVMVEDTDNSHSWIQILKLDSHQSQAGSATLMREYLNLTRCIKSVCLRFWASRGGSPDYGYHTGRVAAPAGVDANPDSDARVKTWCGSYPQKNKPDSEPDSIWRKKLYLSSK